MIVKLTALFDRVCCRCGNPRILRFKHSYRCNQCKDHRRYGW